MFNGLKRVSKEEKGFTLIELLAVIIIIGIIAAIAVPSIGGLINKTKEDADKATAQQIYEAARLKLTADGNENFANKTVKLSELQTEKYLPTPIKNSQGTDLEGDGTQVVFGADGNLASVTLSTASGITDDKTYYGPDFSTTKPSSGS
ncbi:conserved hypothetical protein [[Clostridium] ultunense Esp]|nr:conserved hypothetical protein [[Clostridium] ultunense Esp]